MSIIKMNKETFNYVSPASGNEWTFEYLCEKVAQRSENTHININGFSIECESPFGDKDLLLCFSIKTEAMWTNSPIIEVHGSLPLHITGNSDLEIGWSCGNNEKDPPNKKLAIIIKEDDKKIIINTSTYETFETVLVKDLLARIKRRLLRKAICEAFC